MEELRQEPRGRTGAEAGGTLPWLASLARSMATTRHHLSSHSQTSLYYTDPPAVPNVSMAVRWSHSRLCSLNGTGLLSSSRGPPTPIINQDNVPADMPTDNLIEAFSKLRFPPFQMYLGRVYKTSTSPITPQA